jgi:hypothetical protein
MQPNKPNKKGRRQEVTSDNDFYETMPMTVGSHYVYRDDVIDEYRDAGIPTDESYQATIKRVAVITLIVAAAVAVGVGILLAQGLSAIQDASPVNQSSTGSPEL